MHRVLGMESFRIGIFIVLLSTCRWLCLLELLIHIVCCYHQSYELRRKLSGLSTEPMESEARLPVSESNHPPNPPKQISLSDIQAEGEFDFRDRISTRMMRLRFAISISGLMLKYFGIASDVSIWMSGSVLPEVLLRLHANATMTLLIEKLCKTQVDTYEAAVDSDEFDEDAPPPSISVSIGPRVTARRMLHLLLGRLPNWLSWERPLAARLAKCSVMAFLDRAGPVAEPFPLPSELTEVHGGDIARFPMTVSVSAASGDRQLSVTLEDPKARPDLSFLTLFSGLYDLERTHPLSCHLAADWTQKATPYDQTCFCVFEKMFQSSVNHVKLLKRQAVVGGLEYLQVCVSTVDGVFQVLLVRGTFEAVLERCAHYYDSANQVICSIDERIRGDLLVYSQYLQQQDSKPYSLAFIPLLDDDEDVLVLQDSSSFIWVSAFALAYTPKEEMAELVQDLGGAGIRFVYFSPAPERCTKAFAERLEMETDWNSCIILSDPPSTSCRLDVGGYSAVSDIKARLPHGVGSIRKHLLDVDDIPLHVSFFAECDVKACKEMLRIYRENGEAVISLFSLHNAKGLHQIHSVSSLCIGMDSSAKDVAGLSRSGIAWPCSFLLPYEASPYVLTDILKEARRLTKRAEHFALFFAPYSLVLLRAHVLEVLLLVLVCLLLQKRVDNLLKEMPENLNQAVFSWKNTRDWTSMFAIPLLSALLCDRNVSDGGSSGMPLLLLHYSVVNSKALIVLLLVLPFYFKMPAKMDQQALKLCFSALATFLVGRYFYKKLERRFEKQQKRAKLIFNTKLGMHSPV